VNWQTLLAIDFDKWAARTYAANFPGVRVECGPVCDYIDALPDADVILGGPPCQPHSHAGKRKASADARDCGPDFVAAIRKVRPRMFLMENVPGLLSSEGGRYWQALYASMEDAGYVVAFQVQDAVSFGVPQFRERSWVWGIRRDLYVNGIRHQWPRATHAWPPPSPCMFGAALLPGVTVRQALGVSAVGIRRMGGANSQQERYGHTYEPDEPGPTVNAMGKGGGDGLWLTVIGGGSNPHYAGEARTERDITDEPSTTIAAAHTHNALPGVVEYRWSDAYRAKHPPIDPDAPCQTVVGQWHKGEPNGCLAVDAPAHTIGAGSREPIQNWKSKGYIRRLLPAECARLQSCPDDFAWPDGIGKTNQYKVIGNGWACGHAAHLSRALAAADPDSRTVCDLFCGGGLGACGWHQRYWASPRPAPAATEGTVANG
jgi:site-specific DNA-cytosine methylase